MALNRADLQDALVDRLDPEVVRLAHQVVAVVEESHGARLMFEGGGPHSPTRGWGGRHPLHAAG